MLGVKKEEMSVIHLRVSEFKLVSRSDDVGKPSHVEPLKPTSKQQSSPDFGPHVFCGHDVTLPCYLSPETSAVAMEIRWFKGTDCIYLYLNGQVTEGRGYEGRVSMFTDELQRGNVSLSLRDVQRSDYGEYRCEVTHGGHRVKNDGVRIKEFKLFSLPENNHSLIPQPFTVHACAGNDVLLPGFLSPKTSAVAMEIRWFKGTDCLYLYQNGQVTEGRGYEGRVSMLTDELENGNVSLKLKVYQSDGGEYRCEKSEKDVRVIRVTIGPKSQKSQGEGGVMKCFLQSCGLNRICLPSHTCSPCLIPVLSAWLRHFQGTAACPPPLLPRPASSLFQTAPQTGQATTHQCAIMDRSCRLYCLIDTLSQLRRR
ncbi:hypothetical protein SRHO_G00049350 [Serrasalmus rhombeus]